MAESASDLPLSYGFTFAALSLSNVQDEPRPWLARAVLLGARIVTAMVVGSGALLGLFMINTVEQLLRDLIYPDHRRNGYSVQQPRRILVNLLLRHSMPDWNDNILLLQDF